MKDFLELVLLGACFILFVAGITLAIFSPLILIVWLIAWAL